MRKKKKEKKKMKKKKKKKKKIVVYRSFCLLYFQFIYKLTVVKKIWRKVKEKGMYGGEKGEEKREKETVYRKLRKERKRE